MAESARVRQELKEIARVCRMWRRGLFPAVSQLEIARQTGFTHQMISCFENGKADSAVILAWYIRHGCDIGRTAENDD